MFRVGQRAGSARKAPQKKRKPRVEMLQWLLEQGDLLEALFAFIPMRDALLGLGMTSRAWHAAVDRTLPRVVIKGRVPVPSPEHDTASPSLADRFPGLTDLHIKRLSVDDLPALMAGNLSHRIVSLSVHRDWFVRGDEDEAFREAFRDVFFALEWPRLEHLFMGNRCPHEAMCLREFLDKARSQPAPFARLQYLGFVDEFEVRDLARAIRAGVLPCLRRVDFKSGQSMYYNCLPTILKHAQDTRSLSLELQTWGPYWDSHDELSDSDDDVEPDPPLGTTRRVARLLRLLESGLTSRLQ
jgi:hypothetical protein